MNHSPSRVKLNTQIYEEACEWLVHFRAGDADEDVRARQELDAWLRRSPEHVRAYLEVSTIWEDVALYDSERKIDAPARIARALADDNVIALDPVGTESPGTPAANLRPPIKRERWRWAIAASIALIVVTVGSIGWVVLQAPTYATAMGEQRSITLDDGSSVELNARSRIRVRFTERQRSVELLEGQALFRVAKDTVRPFVVSSNDLRVRAIGTQFDVNRRKFATTVTVIEGKVEVDSAALSRRPPVFGSDAVSSPERTPSREILLTAGEQLTVTATAVTPRKRADIAAATAWTQKQLIFDSVPLVEVAEEFNRYNRRPIVIRDKELESFGVIGVFSSTDPASLLRFLRAQPEIGVIERSSEISITRK